MIYDIMNECTDTRVLNLNATISTIEQTHLYCAGLF